MNEQIQIPESYLALFKGPGQRLTAPAEVIFEGYDLCEDLAQMLSDKCRGVHQVDNIDERTVLERAHEGLMNPGSPVGEKQAIWVIRRTAELLDWLAYLPSACAMSAEAQPQT